MAKAVKNEEGVKRGKEKRRKKRTKRGLLGEGVRVLFLRNLPNFLVTGGVWGVVAVFLWLTPWRSLRTGLIVNLNRVRVCVWCPDVTDVLVSLSSVVIELCDVLIGNLWNRSPFLSPKSGFGQPRRKR